MGIRIDAPTGLPVPTRTDRGPRRKRQARVPGPGDVDQVDAAVLRDPGVHATPEDFGAGVGRGLADFGAAAGRVAADFATMRREAEDDTAGAAGLSEARVRFTKVAQGLQAQATTAEGFTRNLDKALGEETDAILRDLREVRGLRPSKRGEAAIRRQLGLLRSRMVARGAMFEHGARLAQLGRDVDASVAEAGMAAFDAPADFLAIIAETEASLAKFKNKLPPDILAAKVAAARETIAGNAVAGLIERDPALAREGLEAGVFDDHLPAADRERLLTRAEAAVRDRRAHAERGQIRDRAGADAVRRLVVLEGAIERGEAGEQAIDEAADVLDEPTRARLHDRLEARRAEDAARDRRIEKVSAVLAGRAPATGEGDGKPDGGDLHPGAPGWHQAVNDHYASLAPALETMDPDGRARFEDDYARTTGVLPEAVLKQVRAGLLSGEPAAQAAAAQRLARLKDSNPALVSAIPADERSRAAAIAEFFDLGLPPARAVELAAEKPAGVGEDDQLAGEDDELTMGAAREAAKAAAAAALREASKIGRMILNRLKGLRAEKGEGQPPGPGVIAVETVANVVRAELEERDQARAKAGKEPTLRKLQLVPEDFGPDADPAEVIRAIAEARLIKAIRPNEPEVQLNLEPVEDAWAARVKKDTARLGRAVDLAGLRHAIDVSQINHAFNDHGPGNENDPDNEPISPDAIAAYLEVVKNYDRIRGVRAKGGTARVAFEKRVDGLAVVVEAARTKEKTLAFFTMWIEKQ